MKSFTGLDYPFSKALSPHLDQLENLETAWIQEYSTFSPAIAVKLSKVKVAYFTAIAFPDASLDVLIAAARWNLYIFAVDEFFSSSPVDELLEVCLRIRQLMAGVVLTDQDHVIFSQFSTCLAALAPHATRYWMERFQQHNHSVLEELLTERFYNSQSPPVYPSVSNYLGIREKLFGGDCACDLAELAAGIPLPPKVYMHPVIALMRRRVVNMLAWTNDLHSAQKEWNDHEVMNLVLVIRNERKCSFDNAVAEAVRMHNACLEEYLQLKTSLPGFGVLQMQVEHYISCLERCLVGHFYSFDRSKRYS